MELIAQLNQQKNHNAQVVLLVLVIQEILTSILLALLAMQVNILQLE
jgi:Kef-type K+ transport system membrane component KefB